MKKILFLILLTYFLTLFQSSFVVFFNVRGMVPNLVLIFIFLFNIFEKPSENSGIAAAAAGGFFLDIFSGGHLGINLIILTALSFLIKYFLKNIFTLPFSKKL